MLNMHEEFLFEHLLNHDFLEGKVLNYVAKRDNLSRKKLYLAFHKRWSLPEQGDDKTRICMTWTRPDDDANDENYNNVDDVTSLVFISRVGDATALNSCALLTWNPEYDSTNRFSNEDQVTIDKTWRESTGGISLDQNWEANGAPRV